MGLAEIAQHTVQSSATLSLRYQDRIFIPEQLLQTKHSIMHVAVLSIMLSWCILLVTCATGAVTFALVLCLALPVELVFANAFALSAPCLRVLGNM